MHLLNISFPTDEIPKLTPEAIIDGLTLIPGNHTDSRYVVTVVWVENYPQDLFKEEKEDATV